MTITSAQINVWQKEITRLNKRLVASKESWESLRQYNIKLEKALCECISLLAQHEVAIPTLPEPVDAIVQERFITAIKGE